MDDNRVNQDLGNYFRPPGSWPIVGSIDVDFSSLRGISPLATPFSPFWGIRWLTFVGPESSDVPSPWQYECNRSPEEVQSGRRVPLRPPLLVATTEFFFLTMSEH